MSPLVSPLFSPTWQYPPNNSQQQNGPPFVGMMQQPKFLYNTMQQSVASSGYLSMNQSSQLMSSLAMDQTRDNNTSVSTISSNSSLSSPRMPASPCLRNYSESPDKVEMSSLFTDFSAGFHGPSVDKRQDRMTMATYELESKRLAGLRAMQNRPSPGTYRMPTNSWSGYGISHTSPANFGEKKMKKDDDIWKMPVSKLCDIYNGSPNSSGGNNSGGINVATSHCGASAAVSSSATFNTSNIIENAPNHILNRVTSTDWSDLPSMLTSLGLDRYIGVFTQHEIDLTTFGTLTDHDLMEIGINAFGARRKILLAISELNKRSRPFAAAPGAERKNSSPNTSNASYRNSRDHW